MPIYDELSDSVSSTSSTSIPFYDGGLYAGCNGEESFRGSHNSIMNGYHKYHRQNWSSAWGPINTFYLKRSLNLYR